MWVASLLKLKRRSWMRLARRTDCIDIGRILRFDSIPLLLFAPGAISVVRDEGLTGSDLENRPRQVEEAHPGCVPCGSISSYVIDDTQVVLDVAERVLVSQSLECSFPMLLEEDASSSKRFLPAKIGDSFVFQAFLLSFQSSLSGSSKGSTNFLVVLRVMVEDLRNK
ncbi:hypothetical protein Tco_1467364 [Tanacetum coccineum]